MQATKQLRRRSFSCTLSYVSFSTITGYFDDMYRTSPIYFRLLFESQGTQGNLRQFLFIVCKDIHYSTRQLMK